MFTRGSVRPSGRYGRPRKTNHELTSLSVTSVRRAPGLGAVAPRLVICEIFRASESAS